MGRTPASPLRADVHVRPAVCELRLEGEIDVATAPVVTEAASRLAGSGRRPVVVDLGGVTFCDARGVAALVHVVRVLGDRGRQVTIYRPRPSLMRVLRLCGALPALPVQVTPPWPPGSASLARIRSRL